MIDRPNMKNIILIILTVFLVGVSVYLAMQIQLFLHLEKDTKDFAVTSRLREYTYLNSPWSSNSLNVKEEIWKKNSFQILDFVNKNIRGLDCSGISTVLMKTYAEKGYESYAYHSGKLSGAFTHVITLVKIRHKGEDRLIIQDPTYNITYIDQKGDPIDFFVFLSLLKRKEYEKFSILHNKDLYHTYFCSSNDDANHLCNPKADGRDIRIINPNVWSFKEKAYVSTLIEYISIYLDYRNVYSGNQLLHPAGNIEKKILKILNSK